MSVTVMMEGIKGEESRVKGRGVDETIDERLIERGKRIREHQ
jgi:hypothetical protein